MLQDRTDNYNVAVFVTCIPEIEVVKLNLKL